MALAVKFKSTLSGTAGQEGAEKGVDCAKCEKIFTKETDQLLICDYCDCWFCIKCLSMTKKDYEHHNQTADSGMWFCSSCKIKVLINIKENKTIEEKCRENYEIFEERVKKLEEKFDQKFDQKCSLEDVTKICQEEIEKKIGSIDKKIDDRLKNAEIYKVVEDKINLTENRLKSYADALEVKVATVNNIAEQTKTAVTGSNDKIIEETVKKINEQNEYNERANNIIIYNLVESISILKSEITQYDVTLAHELLKVVLPTAKPSEAYINIPLRLGSRKIEGKVKPLKIKFSHIDYKQAFMSNLSNIAACDNEIIKKCYINHDLNEEERAAEKLLVDEMKTLKAQDNVNFLYRIRGPPHLRKVVKIPKQR